MGKVNYAAIDIGSNAVRLLIKSIDDESIDTLFTKALLVRVPLRLGADAFLTGEISSKKSKNLLRLIKAYRQLMKIYDVVDYRACATSAMRDSKNGKKLIQEIARKTGIKIEIINGEEEAKLVYDNHIEQLLDKNKNYIYVDVGGGSTEVSLISKGTLISSRSYNIGTVRILEGKVKEEVPFIMKAELTQLAEIYPDIIIIGSGGNINKLFRLSDQYNKKSIVFPIASLEKLATVLKSYSLEDRMKEFKLKPDRADVIIPAADIFLHIAKYTKATTILVPTIGLVDGMIDSLYEKNVERKRKG
ncbi:Ppx/GppA phosphatase family protein [Parabacteroides pacaensis]|uniref:Ppx/GppA phosphatase family protein n=1 Tax=Parabacteroides pacaensis TaxID=2086575 RepID=UPI000D0F2653|nr:exopolyphosphatase [Parabacteroides pacaensis]